MLPSGLQSAIDRELTGLERSGLKRAVEQITAEYKEGKFATTLSSSQARTAYLITRLPATYAANAFVFREVARRMPEFAPKSLLDLGSGPGTSAWAAIETWNSLATFNLIESNRELLELGKRLANENAVLMNANWQQADLRSAELPSADVIVMSYSAGELTHSEVVARAWQAAKELLVVIEPGTPKNFERVVRWRSELIQLGGNVVAPCPHHEDCPMCRASDWCHFATRLERSAEHRRLKGGELGYEDEKFSYLAFSKKPIALPKARIVRHPMTYSGYIRLTLCTQGELKEETVTRSRKEAFRAARRAKWGDSWERTRDQLE